LKHNKTINSESASDLADHYNELYENSIKQIKLEGCETDSLINSSDDNRFGITLVIRPPLQIKNKIQSFINELKNIDINQYYYPNSDIHITIMSIISCYDGFQLDQISIQDYINLIKHNMQKIESFNIHFKGITASNSCVMIQGFMNGDSLKTFRNNLRTNFQNSKLEQTIDKRYSIQTAHSTGVRFKNVLTNKNEYLNILEKYRDFDFGEFEVDKFELVFNDWYQRKEYVKKLYQFYL
jgi:2'-5' RNA ligase